MDNVLLMTNTFLSFRFNGCVGTNSIYEHEKVVRTSKQVFSHRKEDYQYQILPERGQERKKRKRK